MAALTVTGSSWRRYSGHRSMVPPARSMRVGASASTFSGIDATGARPMARQDVLRLVLGLPRDQDARLTQAVHGERVERVADVGRQADGDPVLFEDPLDQLRFEVAPGAVDDGGDHGSPFARM